MKIFLFIKRSVMRAFSLTTIVALVMYLIAALSAGIENAIPPSQYLLLMLFATVVSFAQEILFLRRLPFLARVSIHYATLIASFLLIFTLAGNIATEIGKILIFAVIFTFIYAFVFSLSILILHLTGYYKAYMAYEGIEDGKNKSNSYTSRFK